MKLRVYLLTAGAVSTGIILLALLISYRYMLLSWKQTALLGSVTLVAALASLLVHRLLTRPLERSIEAIAAETAHIARGHFGGSVPLAGPAEFQMLAGQFNAMTARLKTSFEQLKAGEAARRELVANVSHDLRTPMASILAFVEALEDDVIEDKAVFERYLRTIRLETGRLNGLIEELFRLSQLEAGSGPVEQERYDVDRLLLDGLQSLAIQLEDKDLQIDMQVPEVLPPVAIVPDEIKRVFSNLLQNAIRYAPVGSSVTIAAELLPDGFVRLSVEDRGPGLGAEDQERVFERFYRADPSRNRESGGAGLGLAIAKSIVELHGGQIGVRSRLGAGSCFWFTVPAWSGTDKLNTGT
ncbi:HAMP domain-containing protein [Paenibacillus athensensis]|nr:ATP-binding protein [Paenibacillus athensensis]MCD1259944.1 HAMP domain-containing protein [Paenibacillus athensensis]